MSSIAMPLKHRQNGTECQACRSRARAWRHSCVSLREAVRRSSDSLRIVLVPHCRPPESHLGRSDRASRVNGLPSREPEFKSNNLSLNVVWRSWGARARSNRAARLRHSACSTPPCPRKPAAVSWAKRKPAPPPRWSRLVSSIDARIAKKPCTRAASGSSGASRRPSRSAGSPTSRACGKPAAACVKARTCAGLTTATGKPAPDAPRHPRRRPRPPRAGHESIRSCPGGEARRSARSGCRQQCHKSA